METPNVSINEREARALVGILNETVTKGELSEIVVDLKRKFRALFPVSPTKEAAPAVPRSKGSKDDI